MELREDLRVFTRTVRKWVDKELPKDYARELERQEHEYPFELWDKFSEAGFHGLSVAEEYGGEGGDVLSADGLRARARPHPRRPGWIWGITSFAGSKSIGIYGSEEQKQRFLPGIAAGKLRFSIGFTEPGGGTDVLGAMRPSRRRSTAAGRSAAPRSGARRRTSPTTSCCWPAPSDDVEKRHQGVTLFILPARSRGRRRSPSSPKLGMRAIGSCEVNLRNVFVPDDLVAR